MSLEEAKAHLTILYAVIGYIDNGDVEEEERPSVIADIKRTKLHIKRLKSRA